MRGTAGGMVQYEYNPDLLKTTANGSVNDLLAAKEGYDSYFTHCRQEQQGINSKDTVRYRALLEALAGAGEQVTNWFELN